MIEEPQIALYDLIAALSTAMELVEPAIINHQMQVAYIAHCIGAEMKLPAEQQMELMMAGALHDAGALSVKEKTGLLQFEPSNVDAHCELGYSLLKTFEPFYNIATMVRFHHVPWNNGEGKSRKGLNVPMSSHILHLADRTAALAKKQKDILGHTKEICEKITEHSNSRFVGDLVEILLRLGERECFWLDVTSPSLKWILRQRIGRKALELGTEDLEGVFRLFSRLIDFRSQFTVTHSSGIAAGAAQLARWIGFSERECRMMKYAGYIHDLGKLAVPTEILEKNATLTKEEFEVIRSHTYHTFRCLEQIPALETINIWASLHHERLDGKGYPFHYTSQDLPLGSRILAVADVITAITEDRIYRKGMESEKAKKLLDDMVGGSALDSRVVSVLADHFAEFNQARMAAQKVAVAEYRKAMQISD